MKGRPGLVSVLGDGTVLLEPAAVPAVLEGLRALGRERRGNGTGLPAAVVELADWLTVAAELTVTLSHAQIGSATGTSEVPQRAVASSSQRQDLVDVEEASAVIGCSQGYVRRLCREDSFLTARKVGGAWTVDRSELVARVSAQKLEKTA